MKNPKKGTPVFRKWTKVIDGITRGLNSKKEETRDISRENVCERKMMSLAKLKKLWKKEDKLKKALSLAKGEEAEKLRKQLFYIQVDIRKLT